jgi:hypothetical protein
MERTHLAKLSVNPILTVEDLGLDGGGWPG